MCLGLAQSAYRYPPVIDNIALAYIGSDEALARGNIKIAEHRGRIPGFKPGTKSTGEVMLVKFG
jgi:hypothetical protein